MTAESPQKFRMAALDLDGTLLGEDHRLSDETVCYLRYLHKKGFIIAFATGRTAACTFEHVLRLNFSFPVNDSRNGFPIVCANGAQGVMATLSDFNLEHEEKSSYDSGLNNVDIRGLVNTKEIFHMPVPINVTSNVINIAGKMGMVAQYYVGHDIYANSTSSEHYELTKRYSGLTGNQQLHCTDNFVFAMGRGLPSKLLVLCGEAKIDETVDKLMIALQGEAHVIRGPWFVEILHNDICKGKGLELMSSMLNIDTSEIVCFGDGDNDLEFIQAAGKGIAMKNARDVVKAVADEVCAWTNVEDGVIRTLKKMERDGELCFENDF